VQCFGSVPDELLNIIKRSESALFFGIFASVRNACWSDKVVVPFNPDIVNFDAVVFFDVKYKITLLAPCGVGNLLYIHLSVEKAFFSEVISQSGSVLLQADFP
jgi:hypothetical protein